MVVTDSSGRFTIELGESDGLAVDVERIGYQPQHFELPDESRDRVSILLLPRAPVELPEISVVGETVTAAMIQLDHNLESRRNGYPGAMRAFDRNWLDRFAPIGSVFELIRQRDPRIYPCNSDPSQICVPGRGPTPSNPFPTRRYSVCIDGWASLAPMDDLASLPLESVALVELYYKSQVRVYTREYMLYRARTGRTHVPPLIMGC